MRKREKISTAIFHAQLLEAAETERRLPQVRRPGGVMVVWPEMAHDWLAYADTETVTRLSRASSQQIDEYGFVCDVILNSPTEDDRRLLWGVAHSAAFRERGPNWRKLSKILHCDRRTVKRKYEHALNATVVLWNTTTAPVT